MYICVVCIFECQSKSWIYLISTQFSSKCVAKLCLKLWKVAFFLIADFFRASLNIFCILLVVNFHHLSDSISKSFHFLNWLNLSISIFNDSGNIVTLSLFHFHHFIWIVRFSISKSHIFKFIISDTLNPAQYESDMINLCFIFFIDFLLILFVFYLNFI